MSNNLCHTLTNVNIVYFFSLLNILIKLSLRRASLFHCMTQAIFTRTNVNHK